MDADYTSSINIPRTRFPMKAGLVTQEPLRLQQWQQDYYHAVQAFCATRPIFTLYDGPPYANGPIHLGHAFNKILKDIVSRFKILDGYQVIFVPGWDCHGLPIELYGKQQHHLTNDTAADWLASCRQHAQASIELQQQAFQRLGIFAAWDQAYTTMDFAAEAQTLEILGQLWEKGYLVRALKPVHWCVDCASALGEAEFSMLEKRTFSLYCAFNVIDAYKIPALAQIQLPVACIVWTTTPWNLSENQALAVNKYHTYVYCECDGRGYILAQKSFQYLITTSMPFFQHCRYVCDIDGQHLLDVTVQHPFMARTVQVYHGDFVTEAEHTTGIVQIAPAHGSDDFNFSKQYGIQSHTSIDQHGMFVLTHPYFPGRHIFTVEEEVIQLLQARAQLVYVQEEWQTVAHCWRHKKPLIMLATEQWFINLCYSNLQKNLENNIATVTTTPTWGQALLAKMVNTRSEWCISRQRKWGVPLPFFTHKITGDLHPDTQQIFAQAATLIRRDGIEGYLRGGSANLEVADVEYYVRSEDIVDVWFDSGCVPLLLKERHIPFPADLVIEGIDQYRGWFQSTLIISSICTHTCPYKHIISHSFVCDGQGAKMSKSLGNVITPQEIVDVYGADVLRLWVAFTDYTKEMAASHPLMKMAAERYLKIRNTLRFFLAAIDDFDQRHLTDAQLFILALDQHILDRLEQTQAQLLAFYQNYEIHKAAQHLLNFFVKDLSQIYITTVKERQYTSPKQSNEYISAQVTAYHVIAYSLRWLAPLIPFTVQEIIDHLHQLGHAGHPREIMHLTWHQRTSVHQYDSWLDEQAWEALRTLKEQCQQQFFAVKRDLHAHLQAYVISIACPCPLYTVLLPMQNEVSVFLGCAQIDLSLAASLTLRFEPLAHAHKCPRCWRYVTGTAHPLCYRCVDNLSVQPAILRRYF